jgi:hypothetical protein
MQRHIATLEFVSMRLHVSVFITVFYDFSCDNVLGVSYMLQSHLPGERLQFAFTWLNLAQRKDLTRKICEVILRMHESSYGGCTSVSTYDVVSSKLEMQSVAIPPDPDHDGKVHSLPVDGTSDTHTSIMTTCQR